MAEPNFVLVSELQTTQRRDFFMADTTLLNPLATNALLDGEWLELDANYKLARGAGAGSPAVFPVHTERGRYDTQALGKANVLFMGEFEVDTKIVNTAALVVGDHLKVGDVTIGGQTKRGVLRATGGVGATTEVIVGVVTRLYAGQTKIRMIRRPAVKLV